MEHSLTFEDLSLEDLRALARYRALVLDGVPASAEVERARLIEGLSNLPTPIGHRTRFAGKRVVRAKPWRDGGHPRRQGGHGYNAYELIPLGEYGIRAEDLLARIKQLPPKSSPTYGAGGTNHLRWDLDHGVTVLIDDPGPPVPGGTGDPGERMYAPASVVDVGPVERVRLKTSRIVRDTEIVRRLKVKFGNACQICHEPLRTDSGWSYAEGHHLKPLGAPHHGPDTAANILTLCPNHHALCDYGAIRLTLDELLVHPEHDLSPEFIEYHNTQVFRRGAK